MEQKWIKVPVGRDEQLCAGCKYARLVGRKYYRCDIFELWLETSVGRPVRLRQCLSQQLPAKDATALEVTT